MFPSITRNYDKRQAWIKLMRRVKPDNSEWKPCGNDRVCSEHFVDGIPTVKNPNPTKKLGYELKEPKSRRTLFREPVTKKPKKTPSASASNQPSAGMSTPSLADTTISSAACSDFMSPPPSPSSFSFPDFLSPLSSEHSYCMSNYSKHAKCQSCDYKDTLISSYNQRLQRLTRENRFLKREKLLKESKHTPFSWSFIKTDKKMNFYTGLSSVKLFEAVYDLLSPYIPRLSYWRGTKRVISSKVRPRTFLPSSQKKLTPKNEFLLTLMRLRLGLMKTLLTDSEFQQQHVPTSLKHGYDSFHIPLVNLLRGYQKKISWKTCQKLIVKLVILN